MTPEQKKSFREKGYLYIRGAAGKDLVQPVKAYVLNELKRLKIWSTGRDLSRKLAEVPIFQQTGKLGQLIRYPGLNEKLISQGLYSAMRHLAGVPLSSGQEAQLLISLPHKADWTLERLNWHRDIASSQSGRIPGVQAFILLDDLSVKGGATMALAGSHRLKRPSLAIEATSRLIVDNASHSVMVRDVELSVVEMTGQAGDVYLMDMRLLHAPSINSARKPRIMATARYYAK